jgi:hypothetical protein
MINVRRAGPDDAEFILRALHYRTSFRLCGCRKSNAYARRWDDPTTASFIIEHATRPVGHLLMRDLANDWSIAEVSQILVTEQRRGFGLAAVDFAKNHAFIERTFRDLAAYGMLAREYLVR